MPEPFKVQAKAYRQLYLWFLPYSPSDVDVISRKDDLEKPKAHLTHGFDYELLADDEWRLHIDISLDVLAVAKIKTRVSFEGKCPSKQLFHPDILTPMIKLSVDVAQKAFFEQCKANSIAATFKMGPDIDEQPKKMVPHMIEQFHIRNKEQAGHPKLNEGGISFTYGKITMLVLGGTFFILDEILHLNKTFDLKHNQLVFHKIVPEPIYYTIKLKCAELPKGKIRLEFLQQILFLTCLDCAIQLLLDRHAETLAQILLKKGLTREKLDLFIVKGSKLLKETKEHFTKSGAHITNFDERHAWNSLIN